MFSPFNKFVLVTVKGLNLLIYMRGVVLLFIFHFFFSSFHIVFLSSNSHHRPGVPPGIFRQPLLPHTSTRRNMNFKVFFFVGLPSPISKNIFCFVLLLFGITHRHMVLSTLHVLYFLCQCCCRLSVCRVAALA